jgi:hypothetical protein
MFLSHRRCFLDVETTQPTTVLLTFSTFGSSRPLSEATSFVSGFVWCCSNSCFLARFPSFDFEILRFRPFLHECEPLLHVSTTFSEIVRIPLLPGRHVLRVSTAKLARAAIRAQCMLSPSFASCGSQTALPTVPEPPPQLPMETNTTRRMTMAPLRRATVFVGGLVRGTESIMPACKAVEGVVHCAFLSLDLIYERHLSHERYGAVRICIFSV